MQDTRTDLSEVGEFKLIELLTHSFPITNTSTVKGIGDDAAVLEYGNKQTLVSTDLLIEGIHFDMTYTPLKHLGYKAMVVNISDICAMNGTAKQTLVSLAASNRFSLESLQELYAGMHMACQRFGVDLIGGDTTSSPSGLFLSITMLGEADKNNICYRNGAKANDLICVSGNLGAAYAGLLVLQREKVTFQANEKYQPDLATYEYVLERQLKPEPRVDIVRKLAENSIKPSSMIDISDGLASEILHLCEQSDTGCEVYLDKIPIDYETSRTIEEFKILPETAALNGGEDYELLFTISQKDYDKIKNEKDIHIIGFMTDVSARRKLVTPQNTVVDIQASGWNHYRNTTGNNKSKN